jgi:exosome complex component RRP45
MVREVEPPTIQKEFLLAALAEGKRLDGRLPLQQRKIEVQFDGDLGVCQVRIGETA